MNKSIKTIETIKLQGIGTQGALKVEELQVNMLLCWNCAYAESYVKSIEQISKCFYLLTTINVKTGQEFSRKLKIGRLVGVATDKNDMVEYFVTEVEVIDIPEVAEIIEEEQEEIKQNLVTFIINNCEHISKLDNGKMLNDENLWELNILELEEIKKNIIQYENNKIAKFEIVNNIAVITTNSNIKYQCKYAICEESQEEYKLETIDCFNNHRNQFFIVVEVNTTSTDCNTITNAIETPLQPLQSIVIKNQSIIFNYNNISIHARIELYTSRITQESYKQINDITIVKDNNIIYKAYNICFPLDAPKEYNIIDFNNYAEYICKYILSQESENIDFYWTNIKLNELLKNKNTTNFEYIIRSMKKSELEQIKQAEYQEKQNNINIILKEIEQICNDKQLLFYKDYSNITIIANIEYYTNKERILSVLKTFKSSNNDNEKDYNKWFKPFEIANISLYYSDTLELLKQSKESLLKYKYIRNKAI